MVYECVVNPCLSAGKHTCMKARGRQNVSSLSHSSPYCLDTGRSST